MWFQHVKNLTIKIENTYLDCARFAAGFYVPDLRYNSSVSDCSKNLKSGEEEFSNWRLEIFGKTMKGWR